MTSTYSAKVRYLNRSARQMSNVKTLTGIFKIHFDCSFLRRSLTSLYGNLLVTVWRFFALWAPPSQPFCGKRYLCRIDTLCNSQCLLGWVGLLFVLGGGSLSLSFFLLHWTVRRNDECRLFDPWSRNGGRFVCPGCLGGARQIIRAKDAIGFCEKRKSTVNV